MASPHSQLSSMVFSEANANVSYPLQDSFPGGLPVASVNRRTCLGKGGFDPTFGKWLVHPFLGPSNSRTSPTSPRYWTHEISPIPWPQLGCIWSPKKDGMVKAISAQTWKMSIQNNLLPCWRNTVSEGSEWNATGSTSASLRRTP